MVNDGFVEYMWGVRAYHSLPFSVGVGISYGFYNNLSCNGVSRYV